MEDSLKVDISTSANSEMSKLKVRSGFLFKVYGILTFQLLLTFLIGLMPVLSDSIAEGFLKHRWPICIVSFVVLIFALLQLIWCSSTYKQVPWNYLLLFVITVCMALMVAVACATVEKLTVLIALIATMTSVCSLSVCAFFIRDNIALFQGMLIVSANCMIMVLICIFFVNMKISRVILACVGVVIFGMYLLYDTKFLLRNNMVEIDCDDYILAAIVLYFDIIMLFLKILELFKIIGK